MDDKQLREMLEKFGYAWKGYRKVRHGVRKRIHRHMQELGCPTVQSYIRELERNAAEMRKCGRLLTVSTSRFFRDRKLWECMGQEILPFLIRRAGKSIRVWSAGCACGEEPYTVRIIWHEYVKSAAFSPTLDLLATDLRPYYLERAKQGIYPRSSLKDVPESLRSVYFKRTGEQTYAVAGFLREGITWRVQDLLSEVPDSPFDLIFLRNSLFTYHRDGTQVRVLRKILRRLRPDGILVVGSHEKLPSVESGLVVYGSLPYVFRKRWAVTGCSAHGPLEMLTKRV